MKIIKDLEEGNETTSVKNREIVKSNEEISEKIEEEKGNESKFEQILKKYYIDMIGS
jgi:hypothetical protein